MFSLTVCTNHSRNRYKVVARFPTFKSAFHACRRMNEKYWRGLTPYSPEVAIIRGGTYMPTDQPIFGNYGRRTFDEQGFQTSFTPIENL